MGFLLMPHFIHSEKPDGLQFASSKQHIMSQCLFGEMGVTESLHLEASKKASTRIAEFLGQIIKHVAGPGAQSCRSEIEAETACKKRHPKVAKYKLQPTELPMCIQNSW